ncbi:malto-oligosyltrehalose trehalohydrolase [Gleimia hominis]|uniref:Malto-oligosyltrehalose trehalohydrolase n=1 Tax=Gleimia hominis TaxID=595468 RepID=A0ABU3IBG8_9ACTO|nr:malto-oligosyltrehalose trehalohydrolase [Gleimia hominis]MDT3767723.1 malto-oligosyltrehalose trehalohydrolase [Gleimia hominis]
MSNKLERSRVPVYCPKAKTVELVLDGYRYDMYADKHGWWFSERAGPAGARYAYSVDGADPVADPRALRRPDGVHGPAQQWDPGQRPEPAGFTLLGKVFYELHVGTFTPEGTFDAAIEKLPALAKLGVQVVELMPVAPFPGEFGWGYDGVSLMAVHEPYGGPDGMRRFIEAAHELGLAVCLDLVLNHFGNVGNYIAQLADYYSQKHETPWGPAFDLDGRNRTHVREFLLDTAVYWLEEMGVDGLRLDAVHALVDDSDKHFLAELSDRVKQLEQQLGAPLTLIAESDLNDVKMVTPTDRGGLGMDGQWDDDLHHSLHSLFTGESQGYYSDFAQREAVKRAFENVFFHAGTYSSFRGQVWGHPVDDSVDRTRFVAFSQNHDQVGNRALGDRPSRVLSDAQLAAQAALVILSSYTPMLFQGEEWGSKGPFLFFSDQEDDEQMKQAMRQGRQKEFSAHGWAQLYGKDVQVPDPTSRQTFLDSKLDWPAPTDERANRMLEWYRQLIALRSTEVVVGLPVQVQWDGDVLTMSHDNGLCVSVNFGQTEQPTPSDAVEVLAQWDGAFTPGSAIVYRSESFAGHPGE